MAGYVYVIENENHKVKIGKSVNPEKRIMSIQMISGYKVVRKYVTPELHQYSKLETFLHNHFNENRSIGEWFNINYDEVVKYVSTLELSRWNIEPEIKEIGSGMEEIVRQLYYDKRVKEIKENNNKFDVTKKDIENRVDSLFSVIHKKNFIIKEYINNLYDQIDVLQSKLIYLQEQGVQVKFPKLPQYNEDYIILAREEIIEDYKSIE